MTGHVFVSYAREDAAFVLPLAQALLTQGVDLWLDQLKIAPGANWDKSVEDALYDCAKLLLFLSPDSVASSEVLSELRVAINEGKPVVPILYRPCRIPRQLLLIQHIDLTACPDGAELPADAVEKVLAAIGRAAVPSQEAAPASPDEGAPGAIRKQYDKVMHWQDLIGWDQAVGRFLVLADRFRFESEERTFEMPFDAIVAIKAGEIMLTIETKTGKRRFNREHFAVPAPALAAELQSYWLAGRPRG